MTVDSRKMSHAPHPDTWRKGVDSLDHEARSHRPTIAVGPTTHRIDPRFSSTPCDRLAPAVCTLVE